MENKYLEKIASRDSDMPGYGSALATGVKKVEENKYLTHIVKEAGLWGAALGAAKNFATGAVKDAGKIGRQVTSLGKGLGAGGRNFNGARAMNSVKRLGGNKAVQAGAGLVGAGVVAGGSSSSNRY